MKTIRLLSGAEIKTMITTFIMILPVALFCQSQNIEFRNKLHQKTKAKLDALYPHASMSTIIYNVSDNTEKFDINCHCEETEGMIILVFDTNGNLLNKEVHHHTLIGLPDTILKYMKKNTVPNRRFLDYYVKRINTKGEISYGIFMIEFATGYMVWFKSSGEYITREVDEGAQG